MIITITPLLSYFFCSMLSTFYYFYCIESYLLVAFSLYDELHPICQPGNGSFDTWNTVLITHHVESRNCYKFYSFNLTVRSVTPYFGYSYCAACWWVLTIRTSLTLVSVIPFGADSVVFPLDQPFGILCKSHACNLLFLTAPIASGVISLTSKIF